MLKSDQISDLYIRFSLVSVLVLGLFLRIWGIQFYGVHPDEGHYLYNALRMLGSRDLNPHYFSNPPFLTYIHMILSVCYFIILKFFRIVSTPKEFANLFFSNMTSFYIIMRCLNAFLGAMTAAMLYFISKNIFNKETGLIACTLLCFSFLHIRDSHYAVNDIPATFLMIVAFYFIVKIFLKKELIYYIWAGLFTGIAMATKYNVGIIIFPFILAHFITSKQKETKRLIIGFCFMALGFLICCPWIVLSPKEYFLGFMTQAKYGGQPWFGGSTENSYVAYLKTLLWGYGFLPVLFFVPGMMALSQQKEKLCLIIAFPIIYYLAMGQSKLFFVRFAIPGIPFLCLISAVGIIAAAQWISTNNKNRFVVFFLMMSVIQGILFSSLHNSIITDTDTRVVARNWIIDHIPPQSTIIVEWYGPDLKDYMTGGFVNNYRIINAADRTLPEKSLETYIKEGIKYLIISDFVKKRYYLNPGLHNNEKEFYDSLDNHAKKLTIISPGVKDIPFYLDEVYSPFWNIFLLNQPGPTISIYQLQ